jgi:rare lipoprotein A (peptidoglycan hydrolase)
MSDHDIPNLGDHASGTPHDAGDDAPVDHWVTIDHRHIPITEPQGRRASQQKATEYSGDATYYNLPGAKTASGQRFDPNRMTAAMTSEKAKLGQTVKVTYSYEDEHGKSVTRSISVVVNDRGPFERNPDGTPKHPLRPDPRGVIDLTPAAFRQLAGTLRVGRVHVTVKVPNE